MHGGKPLAGTPPDAHRAKQDGKAYDRAALALTGPRAAAACPQRP